MLASGRIVSTEEKNPLPCGRCHLAIPLLASGVGSEEARLRAGLRPPLKLHVHFSRMQLSRRFNRSEMPTKELTRLS